MSRSSINLYEFGEFRFDDAKRVLWKQREMVTLAPKATEVLSILLGEHGNLVERQEIIERVWNDSFVEEGNLNHAISALRKVLGSDVIQTVPRRGYRFVGDVRAICQPAVPQLIIEKHTVAHTLIQESEELLEEESRTERYPTESGVSSRTRLKLLWISAALGCVVLASFILSRTSFSESSGATAPPSTPSQSFANGDIIVTDFGYPVERAQAVAVQRDGKIVVGGWVGPNRSVTDFALARHQQDGSLDLTFDADGKVTTPLGEYADQLYGLTVQPDGKILAVGGLSTGKDTRLFCIVRYRPDGSLDAAFDEDGIVGLDLGTGSQSTAYAAHVLPDGKILVVGSAWMLHESGKLRMGQNDFAIVRLNPNGSLDTSFGNQGHTITDSGNGSDVPYAIAVQPDGRILVGGMMANGRNQDFGLARYDPDGRPDGTFGSEGRVRTDFFDEGNIIWSLDVQSDGKIIAGGWASRDSGTAFAVARYFPDGSLDNSFNGDGKLILNLKGDDVGRRAFIEPDGRILVAGRIGTGNGSGFGFARVNTDGTLDNSFNQTGWSSISTNSPVEVYGAALGHSGYAISVGSVGDSKSSDFALARIAVRGGI